MDLFIKREKDIEYDWHPGCSFMGMSASISGGIGEALYTAGPIGRRGPGVTDEDLKKPRHITGIPKCLVFYIRIKDGVEDSASLYESIIGTLKSLQTAGNQIQVIFNNSPQKLRTKLEGKDEYKKQIDNIEKQNKLIMEKFDAIMVFARDVCRNYEDLSPKLINIPDEYYNWREYTHYPRIDVRCRSGTEFYNFMEKNGILDKYFPKWYRDGNF